ncbi:HIT-like protein [Anaerotignum neopropionicum]|uniref:HIT-like protein n=1 Tax=Anaerotignum neopropionicum TaxID=36847 RepID=A0A136WBX0_9FIRM|nr:HIT family protein [Anaerotignum neopropionicum]KXL52017.1 HIT-like protein [Anaerotignum neopropionicum]
MSDCIFCKIINGDIPSATIYENEEFKVILDRFPANEGHVLIVPKQHYSNIFDIEPALAGRLFVLATKIAREMKNVLGFEHLNVMQNNGTVAGQTVFHFHLHLIPRYENDGINISYTPMDLTDAQIEAMRKKLEINL